MKRHVWTMSETRDEALTEEVIEKIERLAQTFGILDFLIEIREQYTTENRPHYRFKVVFGISSDDWEVRTISVTYAATANEKPYNGCIDVCFASDASSEINDILAAGMFFIYDEVIKEYHVEWNMRYKKVLPCN